MKYVVAVDADAAMEIEADGAFVDDRKMLTFSKKDSNDLPDSRVYSWKPVAQFSHWIWWREA